MRELFKSLKHKNFRLFFSGQLLSLMGTWLQLTAMPWYVYRLTNSPFLLGLTGFLGQIFILLVAPFAGTFADHFERKKLLLITQSLMMLQAFILAYLALSGRIQFWHIAVLAAFIGLVNAFDMPIRQSFVVQMVGKEDLMNAIGLNSFMFNSARVIGPAVAGLLIAATGEGMCFLLNGVSFLFVLTALFFIRPIVTERTDAHENKGILEKFVSGYKYVRAHKRINSLLMLLSITGLTGVFPMTLMPMVVRDIYKMNASGLGLLMGSLGIGALLGTVKVASRKNILDIEKTIFTSSVVFSILIAVFSFIKFLPLVILLLVAVGYCLVLQMAFTNSCIQMLVTDDMRGRVMGFFTTAFMGFAPLGSLAAGSLASRFGAQATMATGGVIAVGAAFLLKDRLLEQ